MTPRLKIDLRGLRIETAKGDSETMEWSSVLEVFGFKEDVFAFDIICIGFRTGETGEYWKVDEEWEGYKELLTLLPEVFSGIRTDWFSEVAFPAFKPCVTTLWGTPMIANIWKNEL